MKKVFLPTLAAFLLTTVPAAYDSAPPTATTFPCEAAITTPPAPAPMPNAPKNLRIIGGGGLDQFEVEGEGQSGPYVPEDTFEPATNAAVNPHAYYETLAQRADCARAYSLRDPKQLAVRNQGGYSMVNSLAPSVTYTFPNDPDPRRQDAAKVVIPAGKANLANQVRLPIPTHAPESLFVTWEGWFGKEYINGGIPDQKTWQFGSPTNNIHMEVRNRYADGQKKSPGSVALIDGRFYGTAGPNVATVGTLTPMVGNFYMKPETWTRWFAHFTAPAPGSQWYEYSLWVADANTGPTLIYDRLQVVPSAKSTTASWESFWLEFNTSSNTRATKTFDLVAYVRNVVVLKGLSDPKPLLQRPNP